MSVVVVVRGRRVFMVMASTTKSIILYEYFILPRCRAYLKRGGVCSGGGGEGRMQRVLGNGQYDREYNSE